MAVETGKKKKKKKKKVSGEKDAHSTQLKIKWREKKMTSYG